MSGFNLNLAFLRPSRQPVWLGVVLLVSAAALACVVLGGARSAQSRPLSSMQWQPAIEGAAPIASQWRNGEPESNSSAWVRGHFVLGAEDVHGASPALLLAGAFSANVWVNGVAVAGKGTAAIRRGDEVAGEIDALIPIGRAARSGSNQVVMLVSAHQVPFGLKNSLHELGLSSMGARSSRPLSYYGVAIAQAGLILTMAVAFLFSAYRLRSAPLFWVSLAAAVLALALVAETARVWWNYDYPDHAIRQGVIWASFILFGASVHIAALCRWTGTQSIGRLALCVGASVILLVAGQGVGIAAPTFLALIGVVTTIAVWERAHSGDVGARHMVVGQVAMTIMALGAGQFLDNGVYVLGAAILGAFAWESPASAQKQPAWSEVNDTLLIKAEGNYAHITTIHGVRRLVRKSLSACAVVAPLMRVHRSYVVNLRYVRRLVARTGSRYELEMKDGSVIPVSRRAVAGIRELLESNC